MQDSFAGRYAYTVNKALNTNVHPGMWAGIMSNSEKNVDFSTVEARRSTRSRRSLSGGRKLYYAVGMPLVRAAFALLTSTYRVQRTIGSETVEKVLSDTEKVYAPCYWHQHHILCSGLLKTWITRGFKGCFLISSSVDGDVPARIARSWGAEVIRGSANQTGALVLRDMRETMKRGVSIVTTADGPNGPKHEFKSGAVLMARIGKAPMIPLACAASSAWYLKRWDDFMIPKPFARVVYAIGEPIEVSSTADAEEMEQKRLAMENATKELTHRSELALQTERDN